jgi:hypothetical protein
VGVVELVFVEFAGERHLGIVEFVENGGGLKIRNERRGPETAVGGARKGEGSGLEERSARKLQHSTTEDDTRWSRSRWIGIGISTQRSQRKSTERAERKTTLKTI